MSEQKTNQVYKISVNIDQLNKMIEHYEAYQIYNNSPYIIGRYKLNDTTITIYKTNTVLFQGQGSIFEYNKWASLFNLKIEENIEIDRVQYQNISAIGSDEVGTGDYFGPIVVCATYVNSNQIKELHSLGVKDSKLLSDQQIIDIGLKLAPLVEHSIIMLSPEKFNKLKGNHKNLNFVKAYLHNKAIISLKQKLENKIYDKILVDEFTPYDNYIKYLSEFNDIEKNITMITQGEKAHVAIAAASILARLAFLKEIKKLSTKYNLTIYKGSGAEVDKLAISFVKSFGYDELVNVCKLSYANTERIKKYFNDNPIIDKKMGSLLK